MTQKRLFLATEMDGIEWVVEGGGTVVTRGGAVVKTGGDAFDHDFRVSLVYSEIFSHFLTETILRGFKIYSNKNDDNCLW